MKYDLKIRVYPKPNFYLYQKIKGAKVPAQGFFVFQYYIFLLCLRSVYF